MAWLPERQRAQLRTALMIPVALPIVAATRLALTAMPYHRMVAFLPSAAGSGKPAWVTAATRAVARSARCIPGASCLTQAVAARILLALIGHQTLIRVGVRRKGDGGVMAHAWLVDARNRVLIGGTRAELCDFKPLVDLAWTVRR